MIRSELIARVAARNPHLYAKDVEAVVATILAAMSDALARGDRVELRDFGTFTTREIEARSGRNPRTGAAVAVQARNHIAFKPGKAMRRRLNPDAARSGQDAVQLSQASQLQDPTRQAAGRREDGP